MGPENQYMPGYQMGPNQMSGYGQQPSRGGGYGYPNQQPRRDMSFQNFANQQNQQMQSVPEKFLICKFIDNPDSIMPIDVPANGDPAFFVMRDFSCIYARAMNSRGTIDDVPYAPVKKESPEDIQKAKDQEFRDHVFSRFANIEGMLSSLLNMGSQMPKTPRKNGSKSPKQEEEVSDDA